MSPQIRSLLETVENFPAKTTSLFAMARPRRVALTRTTTGFPPFSQTLEWEKSMVN